MDADALDALVRAHPLPEGITDEVLNRSQLAVAMQVSDNTISKYLSRGMPCLSQGGNGKDYEFQLSHCYAWRMAEDADLAAKKAKGDDVARQMALHFRNDDEEIEDSAPVLTAKEIKEESEADYARNKAAEARRDLVRRHRVDELFETVLIEFRTQITTLVDFAEMEFSLTPEQVEKIQTRCDSTLVQARVNLQSVTGTVIEIPVTPRQGAKTKDG